MGDSKQSIETANRAEELLTRTAHINGEPRRFAIAQLALPRGEVWGMSAFEAHGEVHLRGVSVGLDGGSAEAMATAMVRLVEMVRRDDDELRELDRSTGQLVEIVVSGMHQIAFCARELLGTGVIGAGADVPEGSIRAWIDAFEEAMRAGSTSGISGVFDGVELTAVQSDTTVLLHTAREPDEVLGEAVEIEDVALDIAQMLSGTVRSVAVLGRRHIEVAEYDVVVTLADGFEAVVPVSLGSTGSGSMGVEPTHVLGERDARATEILAGALTAGSLSGHTNVDEVAPGFERLGANRFEAGVVARHQSSGLCVLLRRA